MARPRELLAQRQGASLWRSGTYLYDGAGNVTNIGTGYFLYDRVSRLLDGHVMDGPTGGGLQRYQTYTFDPFGNLTAIGGDPWAPGRSTPTSPATNRLTGGTYDGAGNLTAWQGNSYSYDAFGMMTRSVTSGEDRRFLYTAGDERLWSFRLGGGSSAWALRDLDGRVLREYEAHVNWATAKDYVYRDGHLLATSHPSEGVRHLHLDHLGTPRLLTGSAGYAGGLWIGGAANCKAAPGDYDGDGDLNLSLKCGPAWHFYGDDGTYLKGLWTGGSDSEVPVPADYDGDGDDDPVAYHGGAWHFYDYVTGAYRGVWTGGTGNCLPAPADYDGDGNADLSLKCGPVWHFYQDNGTYLKGLWTGGSDSDVPVPADYDGDGAEEPAVFNGGAWLFYDYLTGAAHGIWTGVAGALRPALFDYDGDGTTDLTVYADGAWHLFYDDGSHLQGLWVGITTNFFLVPGNYRGDPVAEEPALYSGGAWHFFSFAGMPLSYHAYFPFGEELTSPFQDTEQMKFTGHERDLNNLSSVADDLDYMHARFCSPLTGRFLSVDPKQRLSPLKDPQRWNRYSYVPNNPLKLLDPNGKEQITFTIVTQIKAPAIVAPFLGVPPIRSYAGGVKTFQRFTLETDPRKSAEPLVGKATKGTGEARLLDSQGNTVDKATASSEGLNLFTGRGSQGTAFGIATGSAANPLQPGAPPITYSLGVSANPSGTSFSLFGTYGGYPTLTVTATNESGQTVSFEFSENASTFGALSLLPGVGDQQINQMCTFGSTSSCQPPPN